MILRAVCLAGAVAAAGAGVAGSSYALLAVAVGLGGVALADDALWRRLGRWWAAEHASSGPGRPPRRALALAGGAAVLSALAVALSWHDTFSAAAIVLWGIALGCLLAAGALLDRLRLADLRAWGRAARDPRHRPEIASVAGVTLIGLALRTYELASYPPAVHGDEGEMGLLALDILAGRRYPFFATSPFWGLPYLFNYLQAGSLALFGTDVVGLRILSALVGTACIPIVYLIGRVGWGPVAGAVAAWLLAVSHLHIHYSRMGTIFVESALAMAVMMLLLAVASERGRRSAAQTGAAVAGATRLNAAPASAPSGARVTPARAGQPAGLPALWTLLIAAGLVAGLAQYFYYASRVVPLVAAPLLLILWRTRRITLGQGVAFAFAAAVVYAPLAAHYVYRPEYFTGRLQTVSAFRAEYVQAVVGPEARLPWAAPALLAEQVRRVLSLFVSSGDGGGFYFVGVPGFDTVTAVLFWLGMGAALARVRRYHEAALLVWFWLGVLFGGVLTIDAPSGQRLLIAVTAVYLFGGVLAARLADLLRDSQLRRAEWLAVPAGTALALWLLAANLAIYFYEYAPRAPSTEATAVARELLQEPERYHAYLLTDPVFFPNHGTVRFIARGVEPVNLKGAADFEPPPPDGRGIVMVALQHRLDDLKRIEARLPGGAETRYADPSGRLIYVAYRVPPP